VENAGVENAEAYRRGGKCRSGKYIHLLTTKGRVASDMQIAGVENAGVEKAVATKYGKPSE